MSLLVTFTLIAICGSAEDASKTHMTYLHADAYATTNTTFAESGLCVCQILRAGFPEA